MVVCCTLVNSTFSSLQLQRQRHQHSHSEDAEDSSPNSEVIVPDYTVDSGATNPIGGCGSTVVVDLLRRFPSDLIETSVDPEPQLSEEVATSASARVNH